MKRNSDHKVTQPTRSKNERQPQGTGGECSEGSSADHRGEDEPSLALDEGDRNSLARARTHWFFGEWQALAELDLKALRRHPQRDRFALLAASAHQQLGDHTKAREYTRLALEWRCPATVVAQVLVAGVHNTLGRAAALQRDEAGISRHFAGAVAITGDKDTALVSHARSVRELAKMGLLPQAATLVDKKLKDAQKAELRPEQQRAHFKVLETELSLLHHELALAQQRQQLFRATDSETAPVREQNEERWLDALKKKAVSQLGQDLWVLEKTSYKRGGFFIEFGASDGVMLSNSWLLEKEFGWKGICAEPNPKSFEQLKKNRDCLVSNACIGTNTGEEVEFILADAFGGMAKHSDLDMHARSRRAYAEMNDAVVKLRTVSLHDFLVQHNAPHRIDYLSIDTEGSEFEILAVFPFDLWNISLITVEHNYSPMREEIRTLLTGHGYRCTEAEFDDWYYKPE